MSHSKGPWRCGPINYADIYSANGDVIALVTKGRESTVADAALIAAAPELIEVARIEKELQMGGFTKATAKRLGNEAEEAYLIAGVPGLNNWRRIKRETAIAKAEGRA